MQRSSIDIPARKTKAGKIMKDLVLNENFTFVPQKLMNFSVSMKSPQKFLPPLNSKSISNNRQERIVKQKRNLNQESSLSQPNLSQAELLDLDTAAQCLQADQVLNRDRSLNTVDFRKKPNDVSYLMETRKYAKEKLINRYITNKVDTSLNLISSEAQGSFISKNVKHSHDGDSVQLFRRSLLL